MDHIYDFKAVISGREVETYKYSLPLKRGYERRSGGSAVQKLLSPSEIEDKRKRNLHWSRHNTKTKVRRLVNSNPHLIKFLTLTFSDNITDLGIANGYFHKFIKRMSYEYEEFSYLAVPEFQKRGAVHYHLLCSLRFVKWEHISEIWGHGFIKINRIDNTENVGAYISKYLTKDVFTERMKKKKKFFCSQNLKRPEVLYGNSALGFALRFLTSKQPKSERTFTSDWTGIVECKTYLLG